MIRIPETVGAHGGTPLARQRNGMAVKYALPLAARGWESIDLHGLGNEVCVYVCEIYILFRRNKRLLHTDAS